MDQKPVEIVSRFEFLEQVLKSDDPAAVYFYGTNDESARFKRTFAKLAGQYAGKARCFMVDAVAADRLCADYQVAPANTPVVILFLNGKEVRRWYSELNPQEYRQAFDEALAKTWGGLPPPRAGT